MKYDFTTRVNRRNCGSSKWNEMQRIDPAVKEGIITFSVADMELKNPPEITVGLQNYLADAVLGYSTATDSYYDAVCNWMQTRHNWEIKKEWVVTSKGVVPALFHAVRAFTKPGGGVMIMTPVYYPFYKAIETNGRRLVKNPLMKTDDTYTIDFADLEKKASDPTNTLLILCSPHNPVGRVWKEEELKEVVRICLKYEVLIISDEIHFDLLLPGYKHTVLAAVSEDIADNCVICTAPSKTFNLAGMQTSNIIIKNPNLREKFSQEMGIDADFSLNILGYKACEIAYRECSKWLDEFLLLLDQNRRLTESYIQENLPKISVCKMEGTYLQWWDCRNMGMDEQELERFMVFQAELFLDEGYIFGDEGKRFERVNLACPTKVLQEALERLSSAFSSKC